jgi:hypothetical protein
VTTIRFVEVRVSEPWDLGEKLAWKLLRGEVVERDPASTPNRMLIRLDEPVEYKGRVWTHLDASPRIAESALGGC